MPVMIPAATVGMYTQPIARQRGMASAMVPSRMRRGTILNISSLVRAMIGSMISARATEPAIPE